MAVPAALLLALAAPAARAQRADTPPAARRSGVEQTLLRLEDEWARAVVRRDGAAFRRLLAPGFIYTENDRVMTRDELIREVVSGSDTVETALNEELRVHRFGTTAVVVGYLVLRGRGAGGAFDRRFRFTDTWVQRGGRWQVAAAHDYLVPGPGR
ncbi:MAG TPA: nuclear transport factor 2 family protein [Gemmatimonadaceae bacterium]|nr:nuclear transport factor 2 family protein [Gemmatimonadaceae bacterium]